MPLDARANTEQEGEGYRGRAKDILQGVKCDRRMATAIAGGEFKSQAQGKKDLDAGCSSRAR